jgi:translation initiation factor 6 (eIF-6)
VDVMTDHLLQQIKQTFGVALHREDIAELKVQGSGMTLTKGLNIYNTPGITNRSYIDVTFSD